jgi:DNA-binding MarR family transcriptional regulator
VTLRDSGPAQSRYSQGQEATVRVDWSGKVNSPSSSFREKSAGVSHSKQSLRLWLRLFSCSTVVEKIVRARLEVEFGTTLPRFDAMAALERHAGGLTMSELSRAMMVSNGNATGVVARLLGEGLVTRTAHTGDRRVSRVQLSAKGRTQFAHMAAAHERWIDALFGDLADSETGRLMEMLDRVRGSVERHRPQADLPISSG